MMKLKFKPSIDPKQPSHKPSRKESKTMGKGMIVIAMILSLGLLTMMFQGQLEKQVNPNQRVASKQNQQGQTTIRLQRNRAGHYVTNGTINGQNVEFLLDTGATTVAIPEYIAKRIGLHAGRSIQVSTANGRTTGHQTMLDSLSIGDITLYNIRAIITPNLNQILLGMSALKQLEFSQKGNYLTIKQ